MNNKANLLKLSTRFVAGLGLAFAVVLVSIPSVSLAAALYRPLSVGSRGSDVSDLQTFLAKDTTIYPQGLVTGYFGSLTKSAVIKFQNRNGISPVGRVGPITMAAINNQMNNGSSAGFDRAAPVIGQVYVSVSNNTGTINWNTNENAAALVYYSTTPIYMTEADAGVAVTISGASLLVHADLRSTHSAMLTGLQANTRYYYVVYVRDSSGNESITMPTTFQTNY